MSKSLKPVLIAMPERDGDPTEVAVPFVALRRAGREVVFATETARSPEADPIMLSGKGLGPAGPFLRADAVGRAAYRELAADPAFGKPIAYDDVDPADYAGLLLPGGHAPRVRPYLESKVLAERVATFFAVRAPIAAVCHGVLVAARAIDPETRRSVLHGRKTTALPAHMERTAYALTRAFAGEYYLTYPQTVEDEVRSVLASPNDFDPGPSRFSPRSVLRDRGDALSRGFVVADDHYVSARWPGDAHALAAAFVALLVRAHHDAELEREAAQ